MTVGIERVAAERVYADVLVHLRSARDRVDSAYAEPLDLAALAATAGMSKCHFHRLFTATYGITPAAYLSQRRVERAQDLLRATNLSVTEVCHAVGFSSLGSFSSRFREITGETPSHFQQRSGADAPRIPGCFVLMWDCEEGAARSTAEELRVGAPGLASQHDHQHLHRHRLRQGRRRVQEVLHRGPRLRGRTTSLLGDYRWCTVGTRSQPELLVASPSPARRSHPSWSRPSNRALDGGGMNGLGFAVDDCRKTVEELKAKGVEFVQDPTERPYGVEAVCRDNSGNWMVLVEVRS